MIAINDFIALKGTSGSSRGSRLINDALSDDFQVALIRPSSEAKFRILRLLNMVVWDWFRAVATARRLGANVVIHTANTGGSGRGVESIVVMWDTMVLDHPRLFDSGYGIYAKVMFSHAIRNARLVVAPSEHSRRRILHHWPDADVRVIALPAYNAMAELPATVNADRSKNVLVVSSIDKHKRLSLAVETVAKVRAQGVDLTMTLVVRPGNDQHTLENSIKEHDPEGKWIQVLNGISDEDLDKQYATSFCLIVPSLDEGFCLPALEAARRGTPVVHADRGALPEVMPTGSQPTLDPSMDGQVLVSRLLELTAEDVWHDKHRAVTKQAEKFSQDRYRSGWNSVISEVLK